MSSPTVAAIGTWTAAHDLPAAAAWFGQHDGPVLLAGSTKVLLVGGADSVSAPVSQAAFYDPAADSWQPAGTLLTPRRLPTLTGLSDGKALLAGGIGGSGRAALGTAELYDPTANTWTASGTLATPRWGHSAVLLADKRVLVAGGSTIRAGQTTRALRSAELYDPAAGTWSAAADMTDARTGHVAVVLKGGVVLVCGGTVPVGTADDPALAYCELYDPVADAWTPTGSLLHPRAHHQAVALSDTTVLVTGGSAPGAADDGTFDPLNRRTAEIFDLAAGTWTAAQDMPAGRAFHRAIAFGTGKVLVAGGTGSETDEAGFRSALVFDATAGTWATAAGLVTGRWATAATALSDGKVLFVGGVTRTGLAAADPATAELTASAEIFAGSGS
jgi:N-acetylneuraminic acid mutarotase